MKKLIGILVVMALLILSRASFALHPERLWFSDETMVYVCFTTCHDPETSQPVPVTFEAAECQNSWWGSCTMFTCYASCLDLLKLGYY